MNITMSRSLVLQKARDENQQAKMREFDPRNLKSLRSVPLICIRITRRSSGKESSLTVCLRDK